MRKPRVFLDSNIIIKGLLTQWTAARAVLVLCAAQNFKLALAQEVDHEVSVALSRLLGVSGRVVVPDLMQAYGHWKRHCRPETIRPMKPGEISAAEGIISHLHDAPVLAAAIYFKPDFLITNNRKHFSDQVAKFTKLNIVSEAEFFALLKP